MAGWGAMSDLFDACITDPPYDLTANKRGGTGAASLNLRSPAGRSRIGTGFMGQEWDGSGIAFKPETWRLVFDVLKPGAHLLAFGGSRTSHRMTCAIEDAGFEIRDCVMWLYGTGFPKSHDVSKGIDKALGGVRPVVGTTRKSVASMGPGEGNFSDDGYEWKAEFDRTGPGTPEATAWAGWGTALKPAFEPIIMARKPLDGTVAANVLAHGTGALNIDVSRIPMGVEYDPAAVQRQSSNRQTWEGGHLSGFDADHTQAKFNAAGRWPANVIHDGSDEVLEAFAAYGDRGGGGQNRAKNEVRATADGWGMKQGGASYAGDTGTAARFFYSAKASAADRAGSKHPTVKPLALMRYLCRLVTPPGGAILDPFCGSGTTLQAALECGFSSVGIEQDAGYQADVHARLNALAPAFVPLADLAA